MKMMKWFGIICFSILFFVLIAWLNFGGGHWFDNNRFERARRFACVQNLKQITGTLQKKNLPLDATNSIAIQKAIDQLGLKCPSGKEVQKEMSKASYRAIIDTTGSILVMEDDQNHNPSLMKFVKLPWVSYSLDESLQIRTNKF